MPRSQVAVSVRSPALSRRAVAPSAICRNALSMGNCSFLKLLLRAEMGVECTMRQASGLHHLAHAYILKSPFPEQAGSLLHNPFMFCGGLFDGIAHNFSASFIYDNHHITCMTVIIFDASRTKRRHYE